MGRPGYPDHWALVNRPGGGLSELRIDQHRHQLECQLRDQLWDQFSSRLSYQLWEQLHEDLNQ